MASTVAVPIVRKSTVELLREAERQLDTLFNEVSPDFAIELLVSLMLVRTAIRDLEEGSAK
jgi:hypothetical protein